MRTLITFWHIVMQDENGNNVEVKPNASIGVLGLLATPYISPTTSVKQYKLADPIASIVNDINEQKQLTQALDEAESFRKLTGLGTATYKRGLQRRFDYLAKSLSSAFTHLEPHVKSGELKALFKQKDYNRITEILQNSDSPAL